MKILGATKQFFFTKNYSVDENIEARNLNKVFEIPKKN